MLTNKTNNTEIWRMFKKAKLLVKSGYPSEATQLITEAEEKIRNSSIYFHAKRTPNNSHYGVFKSYAYKTYHQLFCVLFDLKINLQNGMAKEDIVKLDTIIKTDMYADYIRAKIKRSDTKMELPRSFKKQVEESTDNEFNKVYLYLKGSVE